MVSVVLVSVLLGTIAVFFYAISTILIKAGIRSSSSFVAMFVSLTINFLCLWTVAIVVTDVEIHLWQWRFFIVAGLLAPGLARLFNYTGIDRLGVNINAPIVYTNPLVSVSGAIIFLGERLSTLGLFGGLLVIVGGATVSSESGGGSMSFQKRDLLWPVAGAVMYGCSNLFRKSGIDLVNSPLIASAVTVTTSWLIAAMYAFHSGVKFDLDKYELTFFSLAGVSSSIAIPMLYLAFQRGLVVIVTPLMNLAPLFVLAISFLAFREEEVFSLRVLLGTVIIVAGITILTTFGSIS